MNSKQQPQRRHPAHRAPIERFNEPLIVQVNVCTKDRLPVLACEAGHRLCREVWQTADFWRVGRYVIMPDHIHLFCVPGRMPQTSLRQWVEFWKSRIAAQWPGGAPSVATGPKGANVDVLWTDGTEAVPPGTGNGGVAGSGGSASVRTASFKLWQRDFWDTQMRSREHFAEKLSYVRMNPVRKELVERPEDWSYQGEIFPLVWM